ncbi:MAG: hypothetical protein Q8R12_04450 [bacterium]|nr:hypothetical protein [bacterium]
MLIGWILLSIFLAGYFAFAWAMVWHMKTYAYGRAAKWTVALFLTLAATLALAALLFFAAVRWEGILNIYA